MLNNQLVNWIDDFFSEGNGWDLDKIKNGEGYAAELQLKLEDLVRPALQGKLPVILPRLTSETELFFYVVTESSRQLEEMKNIVKAYLGEIHVKIDPRIYTDSVESNEKAILKCFPHGFLKLQIPVELNKNKPAVNDVMSTLCALINQYHSRPLIYAVIQRPLGRILRDFFIACNHRKGSAANELYQELKRHHRLTARNLLSIEIQALAAANKWQAILNHQRLPDIVNGVIPTTIIEILIEAVNRTILNSLKPSDYVLTKLQSELLFLSGLFQKPIEIDTTIQQVAFWKTWAIGAGALGYGRVFELIPSEILGEDWIAELRDWSGFTSLPISPFLDNSSDLSRLIESKPSIENAYQLIKESFMASNKDGVAIYQCISSYPEEIISEIANHETANDLLRALYDQYEEKKVVENWHDWLKILLSDPESKSILDIAIENNITWKSSEWDENKVSLLLGQLSNHKNTIVFRNVIPILYSWLSKKDICTSSNFIEQIILILASDNVHSIQDLLLMTDLIYSLISVPHTEQQYIDALDGLELCWDRVSSIRCLDYILETVDVLLDNVCANIQTRIKVWNSIQKFCISNWQRLSEQQHLFVIQFGKEITSTSNQFPPLKIKDKDDLDYIDLNGKRLAIYTLTEGAGRRAKTIIMKLYPQLDVRLNHDTAASDALINLANTADYFIFASRSAAHQAFYPVTKKRSDILYPEGKGSTSIVSAFIKAVA